MRSMPGHSLLRARLAAALGSVALALAGCGGSSSPAESTPRPASVERDIAPASVDPRITTAPEDHVAINPSPTVAPAGRLFVFLPGTHGIPEFYRLIVRAAARKGLHAIGLNYPNGDSVGETCLLFGTDCYWDVRREIITGTDYGLLAAVGDVDSIVTRLKEALAYLDAQSPDEGWDQFLASDGSIDWSRIVVGGHSQGGGHAGVMTRLFPMAGACYFSAPPDWNYVTDSPAAWETLPSMTPTSTQYAFGNVDDTLVPYDQLSVIWDTLGLAGLPVSVDTNAPPYQGSHQLTTAVPGSSGGASPTHGSTVLDTATPLAADGSPVFEPVWDYACFQH